MILIYLFILIIICWVIIHKYNSKSDSIDVGVEVDKKYFDINLYQRKQFLFDTVSEFTFFKMFNEIFGDRYYIFPQINYSHLIRERTGDRFSDRKYRSHIDRRSADFVICDREKCIPILVIDIDGNVHERYENRIRDNEIDEILNQIRLPILRIRNDQINDRELIKEKISKLIMSS